MAQRNLTPHRRGVLLLGLAALVVTLTTVSGCGFKLRGASELPFKSLYLQANDSSALTQELRRVLRANGVSVLADNKAAEVQLTVLNEVRQRNILSFSSTGRIREVQLRYLTSVQVLGKNGLFLMPPSEIALQRDVTYSDDQVLAKESEELLLYRDMQSDVVQQLMRRLAAIKPNS
jgi:LPS-assembly lipoprotein